MSDSVEKTVLATKAQPIITTVAFRIIAALGFVGLIALGAQAKFALPWTPVPVTLQTLVVLAAGAILGPLDGAAAVAIYLVLGMFGVPLFAKANAGLGFSYFSGVTGGYLIGFFVAALFVGFMIRKSDRLSIQALAVFAGSLIILTVGTLWLKVVSGTTFAHALVLGFAPFLIGDVIKVSLTVAIYRACGAAKRRMNAA